MAADDEQDQDKPDAATLVREQTASRQPMLDQLQSMVEKKLEKLHERGGYLDMASMLQDVMQTLVGFCIGQTATALARGGDEDTVDAIAEALSLAWDMMHAEVILTAIDEAERVLDEQEPKIGAV